MLKHDSLRVLFQLAFLSNTTVVFAYLGVLRYPNGTDIDLRKWNAEGNYCGDKNLLITQKELVVFSDTQCGYVCEWNNNETSSSDTVLPKVALTCRNDRNIREACTSGSIGQTVNTLLTNQIQAFTTTQLESKQTLYNNDKKLSRCNFTDLCSKVHYKNTSSGKWEDTSLHTCFDVSINTEDFSNSFVELRISCSTSEEQQLAGQIFRIQMSCHVDADQKDYDTCFIFKIAGQYLVSDSNEDLKESCGAIKTTAAAITTEASSKDEGGSNFLMPYGLIVIIAGVLLIVVVIIVIYCWCSNNRKSKNPISVSGIENGGVTLNEMASSDEKKKYESPDNNNSVTRDRAKSQAISGFKNPLFVGDKTMSVEYAKVNKPPKQPASATTPTKPHSNGTLTGSLYEEIPVKEQNNTASNSKQQIPENMSPDLKSKALKRPPSFNKDQYNPYSEIEDRDVTDDNKKPISKSKLARIASAKGDLRDLPFDTTAKEPTEQVPIYHNSSIPATPVCSLGDPINLQNAYNDAPLSDGKESLVELYQQPPPLKKRPPSDVDDDVYKAPPSLSNRENYDVLPKSKSGNRSSVYVNFRRLAPDEVNLKRIPFNLLNYSARTEPVDAPNHSAAAFYFLFANCYLQIKENNREMEDLIAKIPLLLRTAEDMWSGLDDNGKGTSVDEAGFILKKTLRKEDVAFKLGDELNWDIEQGVGGRTPFDALHSIYTKRIESTKRECLIVTFFDNKSCMILFDGRGNQTFLDLNVHYKNNKQSSEEALVDNECGGVIAEISKEHSDCMLNYILTNMCLEMKCDSRHGNAVPVHHKYQYLGDSTPPPLDFI